MFTPPQMQQALPYPVDRVLYGFLPITVGNAPYVPRQTGLPLDFENQYMALIASVAAIEIQRTAQANPLRMFMYNQCAENNFQNAVFDSLCVGIGEYVVVYTFMKNAYPNPEVAIQAAVPELVQLWCGVNVRSYPALQQVIDASTFQQVQSTIAMFDQLVAELTAAKTGAGGGQRMGMQAQVGMNMGYQPQGGGWAGQGGGWAGGGQQTWTNMGGGMVGGGGPVGYSGRFGGVNQNQRPGPARSLIFGNAGGGNGPFRSNAGGKPLGRYDIPAEIGGAPTPPPPPPPPLREINFAPATPAPPAPAPATAAAPAVTIAPAPPAQQQVREVPAIGNWHLWKPSAQSWYLPVYDPSVHELYFQLEGNNVTPILKQRNTTVDYDKHSTATLGAVPPGTNLGNTQQTLQRLQDGARQLDVQREQPQAEPVEGQPAPDVVLNNSTMTAMSKGSAIFQGLVLRLADNKGNVPDVFCTFARVAEPVLTLKDESDLISKYANAADLVQAAEMLKADVNNITPALWTTYNNKLTKAVNRALALNLSIPSAALNIDSFALDVVDLIGVLGSSYGDAVKDAFLAHQKDILKRCFLPMFEDEGQAFTESFFSDEDFGAVTPHVNYNCSDFSLTYVNCHAHEMGLELAPGVGSVVDAERMAPLHSILESVFKAINARAHPVERNLIITNDGRTLETSEGWLVGGSYMLMLVK
jgi:hypothetical protein